LQGQGPEKAYQGDEGENPQGARGQVGGVAQIVRRAYYEELWRCDRKIVRGAGGRDPQKPKLHAIRLHLLRLVQKGVWRRSGEGNGPVCRQGV